MATSNFYKQDRFDLYVWLPCLDGDDGEDFLEIEVRDFQDNFNTIVTDLEQGHVTTKNYHLRPLKYFDIELSSGYYEGASIFFGDLHDCDFENNDDTYYYYDKCRSIVKREQQAEIKRINKYILPYLKECLGLTHLKVVGRFSNGNTVYEEVE